MYIYSTYRAINLWIDITKQSPTSITYPNTVMSAHLVWHVLSVVVGIYGISEEFLVKQLDCEANVSMSNQSTIYKI